MELSENRDKRTDVENIVENWLASILSGEGKDAAAQNAIPAKSDPELQIAVLSLVTMRLGVALKAISNESRKDDELNSIVAKAVELTSILSDLCRTHIEASSVSAPDEKSDLEQTDSEEEPPVEPNAAEEWLASGVADLKPVSVPVPSEQPSPAAESVSPDILPKAPQPTAPGLSAKKQLKSNLHDLQRATSWDEMEEAEKARQRILRMSPQFSKDYIAKQIDQLEKG